MVAISWHQIFVFRSKFQQSTLRKQVGAPIINPVQALAERCTSYEEFAEKLAELGEELDSSEFIEQLTQLCFLSRALGDVHD